MNQTKTPPWERHRHHRTPVEHAIALAWGELYRTPAEKAWSELCALRAVAEAAEDAEEALGTVERWVNLRTALKEWRAICPRNVV